MTDDEIKKAALNCSSGCRCDKCSYDERGCRGLVTDLLKINNHQQAENERLNIELKAMRGAANSYKAEVERLLQKIQQPQIRSSQGVCGEIKRYDNFKHVKQHTLEGYKRADVVEVKTIETWLYEIAKNNIGIDDNLSNACKEIISRLDGLRSFSEERSKSK